MLLHFVQISIHSTIFFPPAPVSTPRIRLEGKIKDELNEFEIEIGYEFVVLRLIVNLLSSLSTKYSHISERCLVEVS
jgi:hypothetical protein